MQPYREAVEYQTRGNILVATPAHDSQFSIFETVQLLSRFSVTLLIDLLHNLTEMEVLPRKKMYIS